ncbi:MAG: VanZ family protein [Erysipelotrichaceae bacterium]
MKTKRSVYLIIYIGWILMIFAFSMQSGIISSNSSKPFVEVILRFFAQFDITLTSLWVSTIVRKGAHFTEYAVLGYVTRKNVGLNTQPLFYLSGFVPFLDEALQTQIAGRVGSLGDSSIDLAGYLIGILIARLTDKRSAI